MNRIVLGAVAALLLVSAGMFWWQGRAATEAGAPLPDMAAVDDDDPETEPLLPTADGRGLRGAVLPSANEATREERRFNRLDRDLDGKITRNELLSTRVRDFRKLDVDGNNLLSFEEWAVRTSNRFKGADGNGDRVLTRQEFATTKPKPSQEPRCNCRSDREPAD
ncbi:MAG TPA: hypothetical protein VHG29_00910 [Novosphingobium sp.]|nr:hypothetical protein [Novosphingobium sp.]